MLVLVLVLAIVLRVRVSVRVSASASVSVGAIIIITSIAIIRSIPLLTLKCLSFSWHLSYVKETLSPIMAPCTWTLTGTLTVSRSLRSYQWYLDNSWQL